MKLMGSELEHVLRQPQLCRRSRSDDAVRLFYEFYEHTMVGGNGCVSWLNMWGTMRLWSPPT